MAKPTSQRRTPPEVTIMFEPHRLQHDVLQAVYTLWFLCPGGACRRRRRSRVVLVASHAKIEKGACHDREASCPVCTSLV
jgi:hypothetical protein